MFSKVGVNRVRRVYRVLCVPYRVTGHRLFKNQVMPCRAQVCKSTRYLGLRGKLRKKRHTSSEQGALA